MARFRITRSTGSRTRPSSSRRAGPSMTINTIEPSPTDETARTAARARARPRSRRATLRALHGSSRSTRQTSVGRTQDVELRDGDTQHPAHRPRQDGVSLMDLVLRAHLHLLARLRADALNRPARALVPRAVRPDPADRARRRDPAGADAGRLLGDRRVLVIGTLALLQVSRLVRSASGSRGCGRCSRASRSSSFEDGKPIERNLAASG